MIEALPVLFVAAVAVASYAGAKRYASDVTGRSLAKDIRRLEAHRSWLSGRVQCATIERWPPDMLAPMNVQLAETDVELAELRTRVKTG